MDETDPFQAIRSNPLSGELYSPPAQPIIEPDRGPTDQVSEALDRIRANPIGGGSTAAYLRLKIKSETTWEQAAPDLKEKFGVDPEHYRQDYQLAEAHAVQKGAGVGTMEQLGRQGLPFVSSAVRQTLANRYTDALGRYKQGKMTGEDAGTIARYERLQGIAQETGSTFGGKLVQALGGAGEIIGEAAVGGSVAKAVPGLGGAGVASFLGRQAVATPLMPSLYQQHAAETNIQEGRSASDIRALPTALGLAYANNLVLGQLQGISKAMPGGLIPRSVLAGGIGVGEQAGVNFAGGLADELLPKAFQTRTKYGTIGQLVGIGQKQDVHEGLQHAAVELLTFSLFAGFHGGPKAAEKAIESGQKVLDASHAAGESPEVAAAKLVEHTADEQAKIPEVTTETPPPADAVPPAPTEPTPTPTPTPTPAVVHPLDTLSKVQLKELADGLGTTQKNLRVILADPNHAQQVVDAVLGVQTPPEATGTPPPKTEPTPVPVPGQPGPEIVPPVKPGEAKSVLPDVLKAAGLEGRVDKVGTEAAGGNGIVLGYGDRFVHVEHLPKENRVRISFEKDAESGALEAVPGGEQFTGKSLEMFRDFKKLAEHLRDKGIGIEYSAVQDANAKLGMSKRDSVYGRVLQSLGFRLLERNVSDDMVNARWRAPRPGEATPKQTIGDLLSMPAKGESTRLEILQAKQAAKGDVVATGNGLIMPKPKPTNVMPDPNAPPDPAAPKVEVELSKHEQHVLDQREVGDNGKRKTLQEIGNEWPGGQITRERVRQIEAAALAKKGINQSIAEQVKEDAAHAEAEMIAKGARSEIGDVNIPHKDVAAALDSLIASEEGFLADKTAILAQKEKIAKQLLKEKRSDQRNELLQDNALLDAALAEIHRRAESGNNKPPAADRPPLGVGKATTIAVPGGKPIEARYEVRELSDVRASHQALPGGALRNREAAGEYPPGLQPRDYSKIPGEREKVRRFANEMQTGYFISEHPDATSGPPTITKDGTVVNGNGRNMALEAATHTGTFDKYKADLVKRAEAFGIDPKQVEGMKQPVLYRVVDMDPRSPEAQRFARAGNVSPTQAQSPVRTASSLGNMIDKNLIDSLRLEGDTTFSEAVMHETKGRAFRNQLRDSLPPSEVSRYFHEDGRLTDAGQELVRNMLLSKIIPVEMIESLGEERAGVKRTIEGAIPQLLELQRDYAAHAPTPQLLEALGVLVRNPKMKTVDDAVNVLAQGSLFGGQAEPLSPAGRMMLDFVLENGNKPLVFRKKMSTLVNDLDGAVNGLFRDENPNLPELAAKALGVEAREGAQFGAMKELRDAVKIDEAAGHSLEEIKARMEGIQEQALGDALPAKPGPRTADAAAPGADQPGDAAGVRRFGGDTPRGRAGKITLPKFSETKLADLMRRGLTNVGRLLKWISRSIFGKARGNDPSSFKIDTDPNMDNPRALVDFETAQRAAYNQLGARNSSPMEIASTAWAWMKHNGDNTANAWLIAHGHKPDAFKGKPMSDAIEAELRKPGSQNLDPQETAQVAMWRGIWEKRLLEMKDSGVKDFRDANGDVLSVDEMLKNGYFPRTIAPEPKVTTLMRKLFPKAEDAGTSKGRLPGYRKSRNEFTESENVMAGVKYMPGFYERVTQFLKDSAREVANTEFAKNKMLGGEDLIPKKRAELFAKYAPFMKNLSPADRAKMSRHIVMDAAMAASGNATIVPQMQGIQYPPEVAKWLNRMNARGSGDYLGLVAAVAQEVKSFVLGGDASYITLQLAPMIFTNPIRLAKSVTRGFGSIFDANLFSKVVQRPEYRQAMDELVQSGESIGSMPDQIGSLGKGESLLGKVPLVGPMYERLGRAMSVALDLAKIELWMANRPDNKAEWPRAAEALANSLGQGRLEQLGMIPERAFMERLTFLAPSYYRAYAKLAQQALTQRGAPGFIARKQLGALAGGIMLTTIAALLYKRETGEISAEEMEERLNPARGKFLMVPQKLGESGKTVEIGFGGVYVSIARTLGNAKRFHEDKATENPYLHWYRGHSGVAVKAAWDIGTGKDYMGAPVGVGEAALKSVLPVAVQQGTTGEGTVGQHAADVGAGLIGLRSHPGSDAGNHLDALRKAAMAKTGQRYEDLSIPEQTRIAFHVGNEKIPATEVAKLRAIEADDLKVKRITKMVSADTRNALKEFSHALPSYDTKLAMHGIGIPLTNARQDRFEKLLAEEYDRIVATWPMDRLRELSGKSRETFIQHGLEHAKAVAKARLIRESVK